MTKRLFIDSEMGGHAVIGKFKELASGEHNRVVKKERTRQMAEHRQKERDLGMLSNIPKSARCTFGIVSSDQNLFVEECG